MSDHKYQGGCAHVTVYSDANNNSSFDGGEISVVTDGVGFYFAALPSGPHTIRIVEPVGAVQTSPTSPTSYSITVADNEFVDRIDFLLHRQGHVGRSADLSILRR